MNRSARTLAHTALRNDILAALTAAYHPLGLFWPVNVVRAQADDGRVIRAGLVGQADIAGLLYGQHIEIEVKTGNAQQSQSQERWQQAVQRAGGIYILGRSVGDVLAAVAAIADRRVA